MSKDSAQKLAATPPPGGLSFTIHNVYLPKKIFIDSFSTNSGNKALDLEFYFPKDAPDGSPTLSVWPTKGNHQFPRGTKPYIMPYAATSFVDLPDNIFLGCNELVLPRPVVDSIRKGQGCPDACVLYFVPLPEEHLRYKVYLIPDSTKITAKAGDLSTYLKTLNSIAVTNPSPPRSATQ